MNEIEQAFLETIRKNPEDDDARAVYADWLEQRGDPRGEYLRLELQLHRIPDRLAVLAEAIPSTWVEAISRWYDVVLVATGPSKIMTIKNVREITGLGLKETVDAVDRASELEPFTVRLRLPRRDADAVAQKLRDASADVRVVPTGRTSL